MHPAGKSRDAIRRNSERRSCLFDNAHRLNIHGLVQVLDASVRNTDRTWLDFFVLAVASASASFPDGLNALFAVLWGKFERSVQLM